MVPKTNGLLLSFKSLRGPGFKARMQELAVLAGLIHPSANKEV